MASATFDSEKKKKTGSTITLLLIDVQKDFHPGGSLAIPTANDDAKRIAEFIRNNCTNINRIVATMDSHQKLHIAHPYFWNETPAPFTIISSQDLINKKYTPRKDINLSNTIIDPDIFPNNIPKDDNNGNIDIDAYCIEYTKRLEENGRFQLCIWPEHCLIGSIGHTIVDNVYDAIQEWNIKTGNSVEWILKGQTLLTEMYSALAADVPINIDTAFNNTLHESLLQSSDNNKLIVCGQAMSHCVNYTLRDIVSKWPIERRSDIILLTDCASSVPGFESDAEIFQNDMKQVGVQLQTSKEI